MSDPRLYEGDTYVLLEPGQGEQFLSRAELLAKLQDLIAQFPDQLPRDVQRFSALQEQATYLMETSCEFDLGPGEFLQWYLVRLEK
jgi:hypothetical protein